MCPCSKKRCQWIHHFHVFKYHGSLCSYHGTMWGSSWDLRFVDVSNMVWHICSNHELSKPQLNSLPCYNWIIWGIRNQWNICSKNNETSYGWVLIEKQGHYLYEKWNQELGYLIWMLPCLNLFHVMCFSRRNCIHMCAFDMWCPKCASMLQMIIQFAKTWRRYPWNNIIYLSKDHHMD